jgi:hypothetical protein
MMRFRDLFQTVALVSRLTSAGLAGLLPKTFRRTIPVGRWRLAAVVAVFIDTRFKSRNIFLKGVDLLYKFFKELEGSL